MAKIYQDDDIRNIRWQSIAAGVAAGFAVAVIIMSIGNSIRDQSLRDTAVDAQAELTAIQDAPRLLTTYTVNFDPAVADRPMGVSIIGRAVTTQAVCENMQEMFWHAPLDLEPGAASPNTVNTISVCLPTDFEHLQGDDPQ